MRALFVILVVVATVSSAHAQTRPADDATLEQLRELYAQKQFAQVVRGSARRLAGKTLSATERHEILLLKAESHLHLRDAELAAKAWDDAIVFAADSKAAAIDRASAILARRSRQNVYRPRTGSGGESISILELENRKRAFAALYTDERNAADKQLASARTSDSLDELISAATVALNLKSLEVAATGAAKQSDDLQKTLSKRAQDQIKPQQKSMAKRVDQLEKSANKKKKMGSAFRKRGLSAEEKQELDGIIKSCRLLATQADRMSSLIAIEGDEFQLARRELEATARHADQVLNADYSGLYDRD